MIISAAIKTKIYALIYLFETGGQKPRYSDVTILRDGKGGTYQITYGKMQTTEQSGGLQELIELYIKNKGAFADGLKPFIGRIGKESLVRNKEFLDLLKKAGRDEVMHRSQDEYFDTRFWLPAMDFADKHGFFQPLSLAVIFDSCIHSGSVPMWLRERFPERTPANGGNEKVWVYQYLGARNAWLGTHNNNILRNTTYRCRTFMDCIEQENWDLTDPINVHRINKVLT